MAQMKTFFIQSALKNIFDLIELGKCECIKYMWNGTDTICIVAHFFLTLQESITKSWKWYSYVLMYDKLL